MDLLLFSGGDSSGYRDRIRTEFAESIGQVTRLFFVPYALANHDLYTERVQEVFAPAGVEVVGLHTVPSPRAALETAGVIYVGGGNSFRLLRDLHDLNLVEVVRRRVQAGELSYIGASAGSNMACPSLRTTNDMPIVQPASFEAFGLISFQINPHYVEGSSSPGGETRDTRIAEFLEENDVAVLGLREGSWLRRRDDRLLLDGIAGARLFQRGEEPADFEPGADLSWLLNKTPRFDTGLAG